MSSAISAQNTLTQFQKQTAGKFVKNFVPEKVKLYEVHWQGMDTLALSPETIMKLKYPAGLRGVLVGEVTLNAARSGMLGGDVITAVEGRPITSLEDLVKQSKTVRNRSQAVISVMRKGKRKENGNFTVSKYKFMLHSRDGVLGFGQGEGAPQILPGDPSPHPYRGLCTTCHSIGSGFELAPDPDLIVLPPPIITTAQMQAKQMAHRERGACQACHQIRN